MVISEAALSGVETARYRAIEINNTKNPGSGCNSVLNFVKSARYCNASEITRDLLPLPVLLAFTTPIASDCRNKTNSLPQSKQP